MPCYDNRNEFDSESRERLNITTRLACEYLTHLEDSGLDIPHYAANWWKTHKEEDKIRLEFEKREADRIAARQSAIEKLSPDERKALGL